MRFFLGFLGKISYKKKLSTDNVYSSWSFKFLPSKHSMKTSWRRLETFIVFRKCLQDVLIKTNIFALVIRLQKRSSRGLDQDQYICLGQASSRRLQDFFKTSSRSLAMTSSRRFQDVFSKSRKKKSSRHLQDVLPRCL